MLDKNVEDAYLTKINNYTNTRVLQNTKGNLYVLNETVDYKHIIVKWENGFTSIGLFKNDKEIGTWYLYDKKNRLTKRIVYSENGNSILTIDKFNKKGQLIDRNSYSTSF